MRLNPAGKLSLGVTGPNCAEICVSRAVIARVAWADGVTLDSRTAVFAIAGTSVSVGVNVSEGVKVSVGEGV